MRKPPLYVVAGVCAVAAVAATTLDHHGLQIDELLERYDEARHSGLVVRYPLDGTLFPPDIIPPTFLWEDTNPASDTWIVTIRFKDAGSRSHDSDRMDFVVHESEWTPGTEAWETIKKRSMERGASVTILGLNHRNWREIRSGGQISLTTSADSVGAPLFYREVNLPFVDAVKDPSNIRWRFGGISSPEQPPVILEDMPVCGNCHSFSADGKVLAMDVDYANSKGSYVITNVAERMLLAPSDIITWNEYRKEDGEQTFGLLSQISPDGRFVVSTVKDKSVFVPMPPLAFSQLFFPVKGILCVYDRQSRTFESLPGADDPRYVQSNPTWSPDGRHIVFARAKAYDLKHSEDEGKVLLTREECKEFTEEGKPFLFDLYRIPFNEGKGGKAEPIEGAANNGMSNFFAKYSPDGKWIVFCKAKSYMLLQPDSELYIIPAEGGEARRLRANTARMNSWHSFSPNGKWLVFSSKAYSAYTQLFLTHIDESGSSTPAVLLSQFTSPDRAANIPEFINAEPYAIKHIDEEFLNDDSFIRAGNEFLKAGDLDSAEQQYRKALELNPNNADAHYTLAYVLERKALFEDSVHHLFKAVELDSEHSDAHFNLGQAMVRLGKVGAAIDHLSMVVRLEPNHPRAHANLASLLLAEGSTEQAADHLFRRISLDPDNARAHYGLALIRADQKRLDEALEHYSRAVQLRPGVDTWPLLHFLLALNYGEAGQFHEAIPSAQKAHDLALAAGDDELAQEIEKRLDIYKRMSGSSRRNGD